MTNRAKNQPEYFITKRIRYLIIIMIALFAIVTIRLLGVVLFHDEPKAKTIAIKDRALRGNIISSEGYTISRSIKNYTVSINTNYLDPNKKEFFIKLFSIYSGIAAKDIQAALVTKKGEPKKGWVVLAENIDAKRAIYLKDLKYKLNHLRVFKAKGVNKNFYYGLTITEKGESREYPLKEALSPILGYTRPVYKDGYTHIVGYNGIEKFYEKYLNHKQDGYISGERDAIGYVIQNKKATYKRKHNGYSLVLNISLALQKNIDYILQTYKQKLGAKEVIAAVMRSKDSKIIALASSNHYDPLHIKQNEIANLQPNATTYLYEPGSVMKPLIYSLALEKGTITPQTYFNTQNGVMWIGKYKITDDEPASRLDANDIIVKSSNIGISKISWTLSNREFRDGLLRYGLGKQKSGIDIGKEALGRFYSLKKLKAKINRASNAYGYGIVVTFAQLLKAYNVFNNEGVSVTPRVVNYIINDKNQKFYLKKNYTKLQPISPQTAEIVKEALIDVVNKGTGVAAKTEGLEIGGKTGTAMIVGKHGYEHRYHSSFFGFANDPTGNKYTIGVLVIEPAYKRHFASQSAVVVFKRIVDAMVERGLLKPNLTKLQAQKQAEEKAQKETIIKKRQQQEVQEFKQHLKKQREKIIQEQKRTIRKNRVHKPSKIEQAPAPNMPDLF